MAGSDSTERAAPTGARLCVTRDALERDTGRRVTGVFKWRGKSWRTATLTRLVKELPASSSDADLRRAYRAAVEAARP